MHKLTRSWLAAMFALAACTTDNTPDNDDHNGHEPEAPEGLSYAVQNPTYTVGVAVTNAATLAKGSLPVSYTVDPALPAGLSLDGESGTISGTPTVVSAAQSYTVTVANDEGETTTTLSITVVAPIVAPTSLVYPVVDATYVIDQAVTPNTPSVQGSAPLTFSIDPALPTGLSFDEDTGTVSGTPTSESARTEYEVTVTNAAGSLSESIFVAVAATLAAPEILGYTDAAPEYLAGVAISANAPSLGGGAVDSFTVEPALPTGLSLDADTGIITGTPTAVVDPAETFTVTATNTAGSDTFELSILVSAPPAPSFDLNEGPYVFGTPGSPILDIAPTNAQNIVSFTISPALPTGLAINTTTGVVSGAPTAATGFGATTYTITGENVVGDEVSHTFSLELLDAGTGTITDISITAIADFPAKTVGVGEAIRWTNNHSGVTHSIVATSAAPFNFASSGNLAGNGASVVRFFNRAGTFDYKCGIHSSMTGAVTVQAP